MLKGLVNFSLRHRGVVIVLAVCCLDTASTFC